MPGNDKDVARMVSATNLTLTREWCLHESDDWLGSTVVRSADGERVMRIVCSDDQLERFFADDPGSKDELLNDPDFVDVFLGESPSIAFFPIYLRLGRDELRDLGSKIAEVWNHQPDKKASLLEHFDILLKRFDDFV